MRGALNVVLRNDLDGFETRGVARMPSRDGGDGWQGSAFWGGAVGKGRVTVGADILDRQEIASRSRDYSRSAWPEGGAFNEAKNVSVGGNTVWVIQLDDEGEFTGVRSVALGACDPARGDTGPLSNPPGIRSGDKGCGFAYGAIAWNTTRYERKNAVLNLDHPLGEEAELRLDANVAQGDAAFRYASSVDTFSFTPTPEVLDAINTAAGSDIADDNDLFAVGHRLVGHGNRDWLTDTEEYDVSLRVEGRLAKGLGYDAVISASLLDGFEGGDTFVHSGRITSAIAAGHYDLADPFSRAPEHLQAIEDTSLRLENDFGAEYLEARQRVAGDKERYVIARDMIRVGVLARRGGLSTVWTASYRSGFRNRSGTATFEPWTGHDAVVDWVDPLGLEGARITAGAFNVTDAGLSVNTANPNSVDRPTEAGWGRTFFLTLNMRF